MNRHAWSYMNEGFNMLTEGTLPRSRVQPPPAAINARRSGSLQLDPGKVFRDASIPDKALQIF